MTPISYVSLLIPILLFVYFSTVFVNVMAGRSDTGSSRNMVLFMAVFIITVFCLILLPVFMAMNSLVCGLMDFPTLVTLVIKLRGM